MSGSALAHYAREGYAVLREGIPRKLVERALDELRHVFRQQLGLLGDPRDEDWHSTLQALHGEDQALYLRTARAAQRLLCLRRLTQHEAVLDFVREMGQSAPGTQTGPNLHIMSEALRIDGGYFGLGAHQDWSSGRGSLDAATVWIPLVDVDEANFPVEVIPGSHTRGLARSADNGLFDEVSEVESRDFRPLELRRGDALVFSAFLVHRTRVRAGMSPRVAVSQRFDDLLEDRYAAAGHPARYAAHLDRSKAGSPTPSPEEVEAVFTAIHRRVETRQVGRG